MSIGFNKIVLVGRLTKDPEGDFTKQGIPRSRFSLAVDKTFREGTNFFNVVAYRKTADFVNQYLSKGRLVLIEGELDQSRYQTQQGENKEYYSIQAARVQFMETKQQAQRNNQQGNVQRNNPQGGYQRNNPQGDYQKPYEPPAQNEEYYDGPGEDDEVPF